MKTIEEKDELIKELQSKQVEVKMSLESLLAKLKSESVDVYEKVIKKCKDINSGESRCDLYHSCIGDTGARVISLKLANSKTLRYLTLGFNKIGIEGAKALAESLSSCQSLEKLYFGRK